MEEVKIFKLTKRFIKLYIGVGILFCLFGFCLIIYSFIKEFKTEFLGGIYNYIIYLLQGIVFLLIGYKSLIKSRYFIKWNEEELIYLLPENKKPEVIKFDEIQKIDIQLFEVKIICAKGERKLKLANVEYKDLRKFKSKLEELKLQLGKQL